MEIKNKVSRKKNRTSTGDRIFYAIVGVVMFILTLIVLYPIVYIVSASFSSADAVQAGEVWVWPVDFSLEAYKAVFKYQDWWLGYRNTIFYVVVGTVLNVAIEMVCAYPLARKNLWGRNVISFMFSFTMLFGGGMIPGYILIKSLGMLNTPWVMLIPGIMSVYNVIVARTFIQNNIPNELLEASQIDGCTDFQFFFRVVLPLSKAIMAVLTLWHAVGHWNSYFSAFLYLTDKNLYPLQIFLKEILVQNQVNSELVVDVSGTLAAQNIKELLKYAVIVVSTVPLFAFYPFIQKYFVKGVTIGSVKG